jgi:hypothetical protein
MSAIRVEELAKRKSLGLPVMGGPFLWEQERTTESTEKERENGGICGAMWSVGAIEFVARLRSRICESAIGYQL